MATGKLPDKISLKASEVFTEQGIIRDAYVHINQGIVQAINTNQREGYQTVNPGNYKLLPGLIDLHIHGQAGFDIMDATPEALTAISSALSRSGIVGFLGTTMTAPWQKTLRTLSNIKHLKKTGLPGAELLGSYLEGPFFTPEHKGAQPEAFFVEPTPERIAEILEVAGDSLRVVAIAPEINHAITATQTLSQQGVTVAMGHSSASYEQAMQCIDAGARQAVHLFNGMSGLHHRQPGCAGAFLTSDQVVTEVIADGVHLHPAVLNLITRCKKTQQRVLITDCMCAGGLSDGQYQLGEMTVQVSEGIARTESGSLAGSTLTLNKAIHNMVNLSGLSEFEAVTMATLSPAQQLGIDDRLGSIAPGKEASLIFTDDQFNVVLTLKKGQPVFSALELTN